MEKLMNKHLVDFMKTLDQIDDLLDKLQQDEVLAVSAVETIRTFKVHGEKVNKLVYFINRRPVTELDKIVSALCSTQNGHLADLLTPGSSQRFEAQRESNQNVSHHLRVGEDNPCGSVPATAITTNSGGDNAASSGAYVFPKVWPDAQRLLKHVRVLPVSSAHIQKRFTDQFQRADSDEVYCMKSTPRGRAVIVSNEEFADAEFNRYGNYKDESRIEALLTQLGFYVDVWKDKSEKDLMNALKKEASMGPDTFDCFVMVFLSHGKKDKIMTADNNLVEFTSIMQLFDSSICQRFAGKPKIFLVQACQGTAHDIGCGNGVPEMAEVTERFSGISLNESGDVTDAPQQGLAMFTDMLLAVATVPGFVSWRNTILGSWFIQAIIEIFSNRAHEDHLLDMLTKVNNLVSRSKTIEGNKLQISNISVNTLRKSVYFFPGL